MFTLNRKKYSFILFGTLILIVAIINKEFLKEKLRIHQNSILLCKYELFDGAKIIHYKVIGGDKLKAAIFYPKQHSFKKKPCPAIIYFFGGGWISGSLNQFYAHSMKFRSLGYVVILVDYRVKLRHNSSPVESTSDVNSSVLYLVGNAIGLNIDTSTIFLCGASAGGQLALSTQFNKEQKSINPLGIILYLPVVKTTKGGFGYQILGKSAEQLSPLENLHSNFPPMLIFYGDHDHTIKPENILEFKKKCDSLSIPIELFKLKEYDHVFPHGSVFNSTLHSSEQFVVKYLNK